MSVKAGKLITTASGFLVDRLQSTGPSSLNIPTEKIHEVGNELAVQTIRDTPDLSFDMESYDVTTEMEAIILGLDPDAVTPGQVFQFAKAVPVEVAAPLKGAGASKTAQRGVAVPHLTLESVRYQFGVGQNSTQSVTLKGDSVYYSPGDTPSAPYFKEFAGTGTTAEYQFDHNAIKTVEKGKDVYAVGVTVILADGTYKRLILDEDFTNTPTGISMMEGTTAPVGSTVRVLYFSTNLSTFPQTVHPVPDVKPAAVKGKDIDIYVAVDTGVGKTLVRWRGVQSVEVTRSVQLEHDDELGNPHHVSSDYDTPDVSGSVTMRAASVEYLFERISQVTNTPNGEVSNLLTSQPLEVQIRIRHPETGARLKTLRIPDARFEPAPIQGRVEQRIETTFQFASDSGLLDVIEGVPLTDEVQEVDLDGATGGDFSLSFDGETTIDMPHNATASQVELALSALSNTGPGTIHVSGSAGGPYTVTFIGEMSGAAQPLMTINDGALTGAGSPTVSQVTAGGV